MSEKVTQTKLVWADGMRVVAMFLVVMVHASVGLVQNYASLDRGIWLTGVGISTLAHMSVPLLVMLSGGLLLGKTEGLVKFWSKRIRHVVLPWLIWSFIYVGWRIFLGQLGAGENLVKFWWQTYLGNFWILPVFMGLYLLTPILRTWLAAASIAQVWYGIGLWAMVVVINPFVQRFSGVGKMLDLPVTIKILGLYLLGYVVVRMKGVGNKWKVWLVVMTASWGASVVVIEKQSEFVGKLSEWVWEYNSVLMVMMSVAAFVLVRELFKKLQLDKRSLANGLLRKLSRDSFAIYFVHMMWMEILDRFLIKGVFSLSYTWPWLIPVFAIAVFVSSWVIVLGIRRLPGARLLVG